MNRKLFSGVLSAALVCSLSMSAVNAVTPLPGQSANHDNEVSTLSLDSKSISDYQKIEGINDKTVLGADFTHYQQDLGWGKSYLNYKSEKIDNLFDFVKSQGINTVSVKVAVNPDTSKDASACYTLDSAIKTIKAAKKAGLKTNVVLFYSDDITYANSQSLPSGWTQENAVEKATEYTEATLNTLSKNEALPTMITIGNEVNYNFLGFDGSESWTGFTAMASLSKLVKAEGVKVGVSVSAPNEASGIQYITSQLGYAGVDYDYLGVNLYASQSNINDYVKTLRETVEEKAPGKQLIISNIKFERVNSSETASNETQAESIYHLLDATIDENNAGGLIYDEAEFVGSWYGFFNEAGLAQNSLAIFAYAQGNKVDIDTYRDPYEYGDDTGLKEQKVTINKIPGMSDSTIRGVDIGSYLALKNAGVKYYDFDGTEQPLMKLLKENGVNYIRLRIWNDPYNEKGETYGGGDCSVENELEIGKEATKYGMKVLVDFHYSDFWADPAKQLLPKAWQKDSDKPDVISNNIYDFTKDTLTKFKDAGVNVTMVQVGNEITKGMAGVHGDDAWTNKDKYSVLDQYINAGSKAVREVTPNALITLHLETPNKGIYSNIMNAWDEGNVDYDVLGSSYYPFWWNTTEQLNDVETLAEERGKFFCVMETSWVNSYKDGDGTPNSIGEGSNLWQYEIGPQGQVDELTDMYKVLTSHDNGLGGFYWEPAWIPVKAGWTNWQYNKEVADKYGTGWASKGAVGYAPDNEMYYEGQPSWGGSSWDNQGLFDIQGNALQSLKFYKDSVSLGEVQNTRINIVNGDTHLKTIYANVNVGESKDITLPGINGYLAPNKNYSYTIKGEVSGIKTITVKYTKSKDANLEYKNGEWYLIKDDEVLHETTLAQVNGTGTWYYVEDGKLNWNYTGLVKYYGTWYYVHNGVLDWNHNGLVYHKGTWYYIEGGRCNENYNNLVQYNGAWYYVTNGKIDWKTNTLSQVNGSGVWYKVTDSKLDWGYTGLVKYYSTTYYIQNGRLNWNYNGLVNSKGTWYYVENGRVNKNYTNLVKYKGTWYYVENGKINWDVQTLAQVNGKGTWYYVENAKIKWNYTGLSYYYGTWYYIQNGKLNWNYNGLTYYNGVWYYVQNGRINWDYEGVVSYNGKKYYVTNAKIDWSYTGKYKNYKIVNGEVK